MVSLNQYHLLFKCLWERVEWLNNFFPLLCFPPRKLSLSTNCIEKIANLNGLSEYSDTHRRKLCVLYMAQCVCKSVWKLFAWTLCCRKPDDTVAGQKQHQGPQWAGEFMSRWPKSIFKVASNTSEVHRVFSWRQEAVADSLEELWISYNLIEKLKGIQCMKKLRVLYMSNNLVKEWGELASHVEHKTSVFIVFSWLLSGPSHARWRRVCAAGRASLPGWPGVCGEPSGGETLGWRQLDGWGLQTTPEPEEAGR